MLKIFTTQLTGVFRNIQEKNEQAFEDCARLLAQTITADGTIYLKGFDELGAVTVAAVESDETLPKVAPLEEDTIFRPQDCLLVFVKSSDDERLEHWVEKADTDEISVISVGTSVDTVRRYDNDFHIDMTLESGLVPDEDGGRSGYPIVICALYVYHGLVFSTKEILEEYEDSF